MRDLNERARAVLKESGELGADTALPTANGRRSFASGDRIYFLKNDAGLGVRNGTLATIVRIERQTVVVRLDGEEGRQVMFGIKAYSHIDHGYAATVHKSQGVTVDRAHLLATRSLDRHATYVAMTRHRDRLDVHWSEDVFKSAAKFRRDVSRAAVKDTSLDYDDHDLPPPVANAAPPVAPAGTERPAATGPLRRHWPPAGEPARPASTPAPAKERSHVQGGQEPPRREAAATPPLSQTVVDRLDALRTHALRRHWMGAKTSPAPSGPATQPAGLFRRVGDRARARLLRAASAREARQDQREAATSRANPAPVPRIAPPRPDEVERVSVLLTAEMLAFDKETVELASAMAERHDAETAQEQRERAILTAEAAATWRDAGLEPAEPDLDAEPEQPRDWPRPRGPSL